MSYLSKPFVITNYSYRRRTRYHGYYISQNGFFSLLSIKHVARYMLLYLTVIDKHFSDKY